MLVMVLAVSVASTIPGTEAASDLAIWTGLAVTLLTLGGLLIGIGRRVITGPIVARLDRVEDRQAIIAQRMGIDFPDHD